MLRLSLAIHLFMYSQRTTIGCEVKYEKHNLTRFPLTGSKHTQLTQYHVNHFLAFHIKVTGGFIQQKKSRFLYNLPAKSRRCPS